MVEVILDGIVCWIKHKGMGIRLWLKMGADERKSVHPMERCQRIVHATLRASSGTTVPWRLRGGNISDTSICVGVNVSREGCMTSLGVKLDLPVSYNRRRFNFVLDVVRLLDPTLARLICTDPCTLCRCGHV